MSTFMNTDPKAFSGVWVFCEQRQGKMMPTTFELISEGRKLADELGAPPVSTPACAPTAPTWTWISTAISTSSAPAPLWTWTP